MDYEHARDGKAGLAGPFLPAKDHIRTSISIDVDDPALYARARAPLPYQVHDTSKLRRARGGSGFSDFQLR